MFQKLFTKNFETELLQPPLLKRNMTVFFFNDDLNWKEIYSLSHRVTSDTKLREFQFQFLNKYVGEGGTWGLGDVGREHAQGLEDVGREHAQGLDDVGRRANIT